MALPNENASDYKSFHEAFMQNNNGTTASDVLLVILPNIFTSFIAKYLVLLLGVNNSFNRFFLEYFIIITPALLCVTIFADYRFVWFALSLVVFLVTHAKCINIAECWNFKVDRRRKWQCISNIRAMVLLTTAYCILAVDFNIFPRYLAKTERYGFSLMDAGVGMFMFCNALVPSKVSRHSLWKSLELNIKNCGVLIVLGVGRVIVTKEVDYQQHVTEYGVHWNFFITLAVTKIAATIIMSLFQERNSLISGIALLVLHEFLLSYGLESLIFSDLPRDNFFSANREGIASCPGYIALYLISAYIGRLLREKFNDKNESEVIISLVCVVGISWIGVYLSDAYLSVSRCLVNVGYCFFVVALGSISLLILYLYELNEIYIDRKRNKSKKQISNQPSLVIFSAINNNALVFFLLSNVLTGLINLSFHTLHLDGTTSLIIIFSYMIFILSSMVCLQSKRDFLKSIS